ncbi:hypothetical protein KEM48_014144 [Puccinia striiformis f. sp. tritici PST-130]|nr:hypothetical protein KEM48_014144 [Puccinia striiformis f. sp. tritici PST-130]
MDNRAVEELLSSFASDTFAVQSQPEKDLRASLINFLRLSTGYQISSTYQGDELPPPNTPIGSPMKEDIFDFAVATPNNAPSPENYPTTPSPTNHTAQPGEIMIQLIPICHFDQFNTNLVQSLQSQNSELSSAQIPTQAHDEQTSQFKRPADNITGHPSYRIQFDPSQSLIKQATTKTIRSNFPSNLLRVAKWSSDGSTVLTEAEDRTIRLFMSSDCDTQVSCDDNPHRSSSWEPTADFPMADALLSTCWFPYSSITIPVGTVSWSLSRTIQSIFLTRIRASYPIVDHRERMVAPHSMLFSDDGTTLFAGFDSAIEIFDVSRPGEAGEDIRQSHPGMHNHGPGFGSSSARAPRCWIIFWTDCSP